MFLSPDEWAIGLQEFDKVLPPDFKRRRYQIIEIVRNDEPVEYMEDLGAAEDFLGGGFNIPAGLKSYDKNGRVVHMESWHKVGELREMADELRHRPPWTAQIEPSDLVEGYVQVVEDRPLEAKALSSFGYGGARIRSSQ